MPDNRSARLSLELVARTMNGLAREIGIMELVDLKRVPGLNELFHLTQLGRSPKSKIAAIDARMDEREMTTVNPGDPSRA